MTRVPPHSIEAEQSVLGGLLLKPSALDSIADRLSEEDFYRWDHKLIWRAIQWLAQRGREFDTVTLGDWFASQGLAEEVAGGAYLVELATTTPSAANITAYADIVREKGMRRRLIDTLSDQLDAAFAGDGREAVELIGEAQLKLGEMMSSQPCDLESTVPVMQRVFDSLTERFNRGGGIQGEPTGFEDLDALINGLSPGLYVLAGRPKMGKTTLAQNIAEHVAVVRKKPVAIFSLEMQAEALGERMLASRGDIDAHRIMTGQLDDCDWSRVSSTMKELRSAPIFMSRPKNARVEHIVAQAKRQHAKTPLGLIVIDYLQLITVRGDNRAQGLGDVTRALVLLAHELRVPILLLSQLNRDLEKRPDKRPIPADLRDSGAIEQDADAVLFIYDDEVYNPQSIHAGTAEIIVALQRNGPPGMVRVLRRRDRFRFQTLPSDWLPRQGNEDAASEAPRRSRGFARKPLGSKARPKGEAA